MDKLRNATQTTVEAVKEKIQFLNDENQPTSDRYEWNPTSKRFHDKENGYRFVSRAVALGGTAVSQMVEKPAETSEGNEDTREDDADDQAGVAEVVARQGMDLKYIKSVVEDDISSGDIDIMRETQQDISTLIDNNLKDGELTDETLYLDALRALLLDAMVRVSKTTSDSEGAVRSDRPEGEADDEGTHEPAKDHGLSVDELTTPGGDDGGEESDGSASHDSDEDEGEDEEDPGIASEEERAVPELGAESLLILKTTNMELYDEYEAARIDLIKANAEERGSDFAGLLDDASGRYGVIGWARSKLGKKFDKLSNRRKEASEKYEAVFIKARNKAIAEYDKMTPMTDEQKLRNEMLIDADAAKHIERDISEMRIKIDEDKNPVSRRLAALTAIPIAALAGGFSAVADGEGRGGADHPPFLWGSILGSIAVGSVGFAQSFKAQAGHIGNGEEIERLAQIAYSRVITAYEKHTGDRGGKVETTNAVGGITSEIQDYKYKKKRTAAIGGAALGGVTAAATAGGVHYAVDQIGTYHDVGADLYLFDGQVDVWDGDPVDFSEGDFLPEGNDADKVDTSRNVAENAASFPEDVTDPDIVTRRPPLPPLDVNINVYDGPGWNLNPFNGRGIDPNPFGEGALSGDGITVKIVTPPEPVQPVLEPPVQEPVSPPAAESVSPTEDPTERALYVNEEHGISHEVIDYAERYGINVPDEMSGDIAEQVERLGADNILEGQTLYPQNGGLRIDNVGPDSWTPEAQKIIDDSLDTNGDGVLNQLDNVAATGEIAELPTSEVTFYQNEGFSYGLQRYAAENNVALDGAQAEALYLDLEYTVGGEYIINGPSFPMGNGHWGVSEPGTYSWTPRAQEYIDKQLGITAGV